MSWIPAALGVIGSLFGGGSSTNESTMSKDQMKALTQGGMLATNVLNAPLGGSYMTPEYQNALYGLAGQMANQQGGMSNMAGVGSQSAMKWAKVNGKWQKISTGSTGGAAVPTTMTAYTQALQEMLTGQGAFYTGQMSRGLGAINTQAALGQTQLTSQLGRRGLLASGVMGQGLGSIESGRLGAISNLAGNIEQQRSQAQQFGMSQVTAQQQLIMMARQAGVSEAQIQAAQEQNQWQQLANSVAGLYGALYPASTGSTTTSGVPNYNLGLFPS